MALASREEELAYWRDKCATLEAEVKRLTAPRTRHYQLGTHTARLSLVRSVSQ